MRSRIKSEFKDHIKTVQSSLDLIISDVEKAAELCIHSIINNKKIILFGNGGSAADAQHIAAELVGRFKIERVAIPAIALTTDTSVITSIGNDYGYEYIFDRQIEALGNAGDIAIGISTSGNSLNVLTALKKAQKIGCNTIGLSGGNGGKMKEYCGVNIEVPSNDTARIQELHILIGHTICCLLEEVIAQ